VLSDQRWYSGVESATEEIDLSPLDMPRVYTVPIWLLDQPQTARNHTLASKGRVRSVAAGSVVVVSLKNGTVQTTFLGLPLSDVVRGVAPRWFLD
jgi:hypothetical protein